MPWVLTGGAATAAWSTRRLCSSCRQEAPPPGLGASEEAPREEAGRSQVNAGFGDPRSDLPRGTACSRQNRGTTGSAGSGQAAHLPVPSAPDPDGPRMLTAKRNRKKYKRSEC